MAFKISLLPDFRAFTKGMSDVEKSFDDVADSLDDLARETKVNSDKAADALTRDFKQAFDKVERESEQAGKSIGKDFKRGTDKAGEGLDEFKDEANQTAKEAAASFDGSAESIADIFQELGANAFAGFGPAGAAAGIAAAAGIGLVISQLQEAEEKAHEATERVASLVDELAEVDGNPALLDWATRVRDVLREVTDPKQWFEFWQAADKTRYDAIRESAERYNLTQSETNDLIRAYAGDTEAAARVTDTYNRKIEEQKNALAASTDQHGNYDQSIQDNITSLERERDAIAQRSGEMARAKDVTETAINAEQKRSEALREAQARQDSFVDSLNSMDDGLVQNQKLWKNNKIDVDKWTESIKNANKRRKVVLDYRAELSPQAQASYDKLDPETQYKLAMQAKGSNKKVEQQIETNLEVTATDVSITGTPQPVTYPSKVEEPQVPAAPAGGTVTYQTAIDQKGSNEGAQKAADGAQRIANQERNKIEFKTKVKTSNLQRDVDRAAASIHSPTIYVKVKTRKDVP